jgi:hypothetical protein
MRTASTRLNSLNINPSLAGSLPGALQLAIGANTANSKPPIESQPRNHQENRRRLARKNGKVIAHSQINKLYNMNSL